MRYRVGFEISDPPPSLNHLPKASAVESDSYAHFVNVGTFRRLSENAHMCNVAVAKYMLHVFAFCLGELDTWIPKVENGRTFEDPTTVQFATKDGKFPYIISRFYTH